MVVLNVKHMNQSLFLYETKLDCSVDETMDQLVRIHNGRCKVFRICSQVEDLAQHGTALPPDMQGLLENQIRELKLVDKEGEACLPTGAGVRDNPDPLQKRNGKQPAPETTALLEKTLHEAKAKVGRENVAANVTLDWSRVEESLDILRGAVAIAYPMGLPRHDPIRLEFENREDLAGTQGLKDVVDPTQAVLWFASKELTRGKKLKDFLGKNEKTKVVVKMTGSRSQGQPAREPVFSEAEQARLMAANHKRREEMAQLDKAGRDDDSHLNSSWADPNALKRKLHGVNNVSWK